MDEKGRQDNIELGMGLAEENAKYYEIPKVNRDKRNLLGFLTGAAGVCAVAAAIASALNLPAKTQSYIDKFSSLAKYLIPVDVHSCVSDEMFVGRTGYISAVLWLKSMDATLDVVPRNDLYIICDVVISSGRLHAKTRPNNKSQPSLLLMYEYYKTEYLGAADGLCAILQIFFICTCIC